MLGQEGSWREGFNVRGRVGLTSYDISGKVLAAERVTMLVGGFICIEGYDISWRISAGTPQPSLLPILKENINKSSFSTFCHSNAKSNDIFHLHYTLYLKIL